MYFRVLGAVTVDGGGDKPPRLTGRHRPILLAMLLTSRGQVVPTERLVDALWDDAPPATAVAQVQNLASALRRELAAAGARGVLERVPGGYRIEVEPGQLDLDVFEDLAAAARDHAEAGRQRAALDGYAAALALYRGPSLAGLDGRVVVDVASRLDERHLSVVEEHAEVRLSLGMSNEVIATTRDVLAAAPFRQRTVGLLIGALHHSGRTAEAVEFYETFRRRLADELGIDPGAELQAAHRAILAPAPVAEATERSNSPRELPADIGGFTARAAQLAALDSLAGARLAAVVGPAGVGKTSLAVHWGQRNRDRFPDGQLHVNLQGFGGRPVAPSEVLWRFLRALGVSADPQADVEEAVAVYRTHLADRRVLVLLDNAGDAEQVRPLIPGGAGNLALVTSRDTLVGLVARDGAELVRVPYLEESESALLLDDVLGTELTGADPEATRELGVLCGHLPLALRIAAANLLSTGERPIAELVAELRRSRLDALTVDGDSETAVASTLALTYDALAPAEQTMARRLGLVSGTEFTLNAAAALADVDEAGVTPSLRRLAHTHLVEHHGPGRYRMHDLVRLYCERRLIELEPEAEREAASTRLLQSYLDEPGSVDPATVLATVRRHPSHRLAWRLLESLADDLREGYALHDVGPLIEKVAEHLAEDAHGRSVMLRLSADVSWLSAEYTAAIDAGERALELARRAGDEAAEGHALGRLAAYFTMRGRYPEALDAHLAALAIIRRSGSVPDLVRLLGNASSSYLDLGRPGEAEALLTEARARSAEQDDPLLDASVNMSWAMFHQELGRYDLAVADAVRCLEQCRGTNARRGEALALAMLAETHRQLELPEQAREYGEESLRLAREIGLQNMLSTIALFLADALAALGETGQALPLAAEALPVEVRSDSFQGVAHAHTVLARIHLADGDVEAARAHAEQAVARSATGSPGNAGTALRTLGTVLAHAGDKAGARHALARARDLYASYGGAQAESIQAELDGL